MASRLPVSFSSKPHGSSSTSSQRLPSCLHLMQLLTSIKKPWPWIAIFASLRLSTFSLRKLAMLVWMQVFFPKSQHKFPFILRKLMSKTRQTMICATSRIVPLVMWSLTTLNTSMPNLIGSLANQSITRLVIKERAWIWLSLISRWQWRNITRLNPLLNKLVDLTSPTLTPNTLRHSSFLLKQLMRTRRSTMSLKFQQANWPSPILKTLSTLAPLAKSSTLAPTSRTNFATWCLPRFV